MAALRGCSQFKVVKLGMPRAARTAGRAGPRGLKKGQRNAVAELSAASTATDEVTLHSEQKQPKPQRCLFRPGPVAVQRRRAVAEPAETR